MQAQVEQLEEALKDSRGHALRLADENADVVCTHNAAQAAAETERAAAIAARAELHAAQVMARLAERMERLEDSVETWRGMVERGASKVSDEMRVWLDANVPL